MYNQPMCVYECASVHVQDVQPAQGSYVAGAHVHDGRAVLVGLQLVQLRRAMAARRSLMQALPPCLVILN